MMKAKMMAGGGKMKKGYASGGMPMTMKDGKKVPAFAADGQGKMAAGGMAKAKMAAGGGMMKAKMSTGGGVKSKMGMSGGGSASKRADGVAQRGRTKTKMV